MANSSKLSLAGLITAFFLFGAAQLEVTDDASSAMLPTNGVFLERYNDYLDRFPSDQGALIVFENLLCSDRGWQLISAVEVAVANHPSIDRTLSLASDGAKYLRAGVDVVGLEIFRDVEFETSESRCEAAERYPPFQKVFVSKNRATALYLLTDNTVDAVALTSQLTDILDVYKAQALSIGGRIILSGEPIMSAEVSQVVANDSVFVVITLTLMLFSLFLLTRSWITVFSAFLLAIFVLSITYGFMGFLGATLTPATSLVVFLLLPLSTAFVIHAHGYFVRLSAGSVNARLSQMPFVLAGLTTAVGFASTGLTPARDIQLLAQMGVIGVIAATLGIFLIVFPLLERQLNPIFVVVIKIPIRILGNPLYGYTFFFLVLIATCVGAFLVNINYGPTKYLPDSNSVRADFLDVGESFGRMNLPLLIEVDDSQDPQQWLKLLPLVKQLEAKYPAGFQVSWMYDQLSEVSKAFTLDEGGNVQEFPETSDQLAQFLLLFDSRDLELYMDEERERILLMLQIPFEGSAEYFVMKNSVDEFLIDNEIKGYFIGRVSAFFETGHRVGSDTLIGLSYGGVLIFFLLWIIFRSLSLAIVGIIVNALPVLAGVASLGLLGIDIDMGSSIVAAIAFGIILDDSTHLIVRVKELVKAGYDPSTSVALSLGELGTPIVSTTFTICLGFAVLLFAEMKPFNDFAVVILITLFVALLTEILVLPLLVRKFFHDPLQA